MARSQFNRRDFLKVAGLNMAALALPVRRIGEWESVVAWPAVQMKALPDRLQEILQQVPETVLDKKGYLGLESSDGSFYSRVPVVQTQWNAERSGPGDRLNFGVPWGIVLHWFGDREDFDQSLDAYMRGFNDLRPVSNYITRTSAHFLIADGNPSNILNRHHVSGIIQTQLPDADGTPFVASHLQGIDYRAHFERRQYFVRAFYQLGYEDPGIRSLLQDFYDGPRIDPNMRTIAIEINGYDFEDPSRVPSDQQVANVVSVVWSVMKRYNIKALNILGHNEIQLGKADPGKKFMALIRTLIGVKALVENDDQMKKLVFGQFMRDGEDGWQAVRRYFSFARNYLVLTGTPRQVYEWEKISKFWFLHDMISETTADVSVAKSFIYPFQSKAISGELGEFLIPENHEGVDLFQEDQRRTAVSLASESVNLITNGKCIFIGESDGFHQGRNVMFRHRQADGAEVISLYGHMGGLGNIKVGGNYPEGYPIGTVRTSSHRGERFLHFAVAYGATWDSDLRKNPEIPLNAGPAWIRRRFINPMEYLNKQLNGSEGRRNPLRIYQ